MNGAEEDAWSAVADEWSELWAGAARPAQERLLELAHVGPGTRVLDVGCGGGELLELAAARGAMVAGVDPAPGMLRVAAARVPGADLREADFDTLPWPAGSFDVVLAVNALQFADDAVDAVRAAAAVLTPGGALGIANWAEDARNALDVIERAIAAALDDEVPTDGGYRREGGLRRILSEAGLDGIEDGIVAAPLVFADDDALIRGVLLGEDAATRAERAAIVGAAAARFRQPDGSYRLENAFRYAIGRLAV